MKKAWSLTKRLDISEESTCATADSTTTSTSYANLKRTVLAFYIATLFPGADFNNVRVKDFLAARFFDNCLVDKSKVPRMPWRDVQVRVEGEISKDMGRNFIQYWSFIKNDFAKQKETRQIGLSASRETKRQLLKQLTSEEGVKTGTKKYMPKSSLLPPSTNKNLFETSLDDDSTMTKHEKNLMSIPEADEQLEGRRQTKRLFKSVEHGVRVELEHLVNHIKESQDTDEEEEFLDK